MSMVPEPEDLTDSCLYRNKPGDRMVEEMVFFFFFFFFFVFWFFFKKIKTFKKTTTVDQ